MSSQFKSHGMTEKPKNTEHGWEYTLPVLGDSTKCKMPLPSLQIHDAKMPIRFYLRYQ